MELQPIHVPIRLTLADAEVTRLHVDPGDTIILRVERAMLKTEAEQFRDQLKELFPGNPVIVLTRGAAIDIAKTTEP